MPTHECALKLLTMWRPNLASDQPVKAADTVFKSGPITPEPKPDPTPTPTPEPPLDGSLIPLSEYRSPKGSVPPSAIRFPDGNEVKIHHWYNILIESAKWLHSNEHLTRANMPVLTSSGKSFIANSELKTRIGKPMSRAEEIADGVYVVMVRDSKRYLKNTVSLLQHCGVDPSDVFLKVANVEKGNDG